MSVGWGVLGPGRVAAAVARDLRLVPGAVLAAVGSRDGARATAFADEHGFARAHGSYAGLVADPTVDVVYVATPHAHHLAAAERALRAGKAVLVEKPLTCSGADTRRLVGAAREHGLLCVENLWTACLPNVVHLRELVGEGPLGPPLVLQASLGWAVPDDPTSRFHDPALGGGALLDGGVYAVWLALALLGPVRTVQATARLSPTGVDLDTAVLLTHEGGGTSLLSTSLTGRTDGRATVWCDRGRIEVAPSFERAPSVLVTPDGGPASRVDRGRRGTGYAHLLEHVQDCLAAGLTESPVLPLRTTVAVADVLDRCRALVAAPLPVTT
ncbi:Gfo/Idh/MocA family protein [Thalassiella azotivora]